MWWPIEFIKKNPNKTRKANEQRRYLDLNLDDKIEGEGDYIEYLGCHVIIFDNQIEMIEKGILKSYGEYNHNYKNNEYRNISEFEKWLDENLQGYYRVCAWGNGRSNPNQKYSGIWRMEVRCMRQEDAFTVRMVWS